MHTPAAGVVAPRSRSATSVETVRPPPCRIARDDDPLRLVALRQEPSIGSDRVIHRSGEGVLRRQAIVHGEHARLRGLGKARHQLAMSVDRTHHVAAAVQVHDNPVGGRVLRGNPLGLDAVSAHRFALDLAGAGEGGERRGHHGTQLLRVLGLAGALREGLVLLEHLLKLRTAHRGFSPWLNWRPARRAKTPPDVSASVVQMERSDKPRPAKATDS